MTYMTIDQIKDENPTWFSASIMEFFDSVITPGVWPVEGGAYFVTSERGPGSREGVREPRRRTVRYAANGGHNITSVGGFMAHATLGDALDMAHEVAALLGPHPRVTAETQ